MHPEDRHRKSPGWRRWTTIPRRRPERPTKQHIRKLLDSPNLHRVFIVTDVIGGDASERVDSLLQQTPRGEPRYGRITVSQGIVIDPKHPDQATVFAVVMNEQELRQLREKLDETFPDDFEESVAEPGVVTQLADIGQVAVLSGIAAAPGVTIPAAEPAGLAHRGGGEGRRADASLPRRRPARSGRSSEAGKGRPHRRRTAPTARADGHSRGAPRRKGRDVGPRRGPGLPPSPGDATASTGIGPERSRCRRRPRALRKAPNARLAGRGRAGRREGSGRAFDRARLGHGQGASRGRPTLGRSAGDARSNLGRGGMMIEIDRLSKRYGRIKAVDRLTCSVGRGEIVGLLGPNGAGKTTTMRHADDLPAADQRPRPARRARRARRAARGPPQGRLPARERAALHRDAGPRVPRVPAPSSRTSRAPGGGRRSTG